MKAAYIEHTGSINEIKIGDLPHPQVHTDEVLIRVEAVSANHVDTFVRSGSFKTNQSFPFIIGRDAVGTVIEMGSNVKEFQLGQRVWTNSMGYDGRQGTYAELISVPSNRLFHVPTRVNALQLVASVHSAATAAILLNDVFDTTPNHKILIEGAGGHVGQKLVELARLKNLEVFTTSRSSDFDQLMMLGASQTFDYHDPIKKISEKFDYIIDTSGKVELQSNLDSLNQNGQLALITAPVSNQFQFKVREFYTNQKSIKGFVISHAGLPQLQSAAKVINHAFEKNRLLNDELLILPIEEAQLAHLMLENNENHRKRIVLTLKK